MLGTSARIIVAARSEAVMFSMRFVGRPSQAVQYCRKLNEQGRPEKAVLRKTHSVSVNQMCADRFDRGANNDYSRAFLGRLQATAARSFILCLLIGCTGATNAAAQQAAPVPAPDQALLKRFVAECVLIEPGTAPFPKQFQIGSKDEIDEVDTALPLSDVVMPIRFRICKYEMTQDLYETVMQKNPSRWKGPRNSVETIDFGDAENCCRKLTAILHSAKLIGLNEIVRLPTEAEWEYCCRAGTTTNYSFGNVATAVGDKDNQASVLGDYAWHTGNAAGNDPAVGSLKPNPWQLYDMHGYLWEFVSEPYPPAGSAAATEQSADTSTDSTPTAGSPESEARCIIRGGSWQDHHSALTSASRRSTRVNRKSDAIGFRCVIADQPQAE